MNSKEAYAKLKQRIQYEIDSCKLLGRAPNIGFSLIELQTILDSFLVVETLAADLDDIENSNNT